ncbi:MAG: hypothetical protein WB764_28795 [Xanthobacteraceae bacterium]
MPGELSAYIQDASALLHDYSLLFTPQNQLVRWINTTRRALAKRTGCIERLVTGQSAFGASAQPNIAVPGGMQPGALPGALPAGIVTGAAVNALQTVPLQERYPFQGFFNPFVQQMYAGVEGVIDAQSITVNWGGAVRPALAWLPWEDFQAYARAYATLVTSYPYYWSVFNPGEFGEIWLFPAPSTTGDIEVSAYCVPKNLNTDADFEAIPPGFRDAIKFGAAALAFFPYRKEEAKAMNDAYFDVIGVDTVARDRGKVPNFYSPVL